MMSTAVNQGSVTHRSLHSGEGDIAVGNLGGLNAPDGLLLRGAEGGATTSIGGMTIQ